MDARATTVLLVEDNPADARLLQEALTSAHQEEFRLVRVETLCEALRRLADGGIDVVLLDLSLPDGHGLETVVRTHTAAPGLPIVVLTGLEDEALAIRAVREGAQDYLVKGQVDGDVLARAMRYAVERKRSEEALRESEERYRSVVETSPDAIALTDLDMRILMCNRPAATQLGFQSAEELLGRTAYEFMAPEDHQRATDNARRVLEEGSVRDAEYTFIRKDGQRFAVEMSSSLIVDRDGKPEGFMAVARDISQRKRAEEELLFKTTLLEAQSETSIDGILVVDGEGKLILSNKRFSDMWNVPDRLISTKDDEGLLQHTIKQLKDPGGFLRKVKHLYAHKDERSRDEIEFKDGKVFDRYSSPLIDSKGNYHGRIWYFRDITSRRRAEEEKRRLQEELSQAQKMQALGTLAGGIAHEFNNINAAIIGYVDLILQTEDVPDIVRKNLEIVRGSASRAASLTGSLLAFARKEVGEKKRVNLRSVADEVLRLTEKEFTSEGIEVTVRHSTRVSPVMGDAGLLTHVLMNLLINARHAMLRSSVKQLTVETGQERNRPFVRVRDTGCGIPKENLPRVFEPFFTTKGSLASGGIYDGKAHGTGLGLSVSHSIVKGHGGEIKISSRVGTGTTVTVYLLATRKRKTSRGLIPEGAKQHPGRILVVDDEEAITDLLVQILDHRGYLADGFTDPREALAALSRKRYVLAFVDLQMPEMTGEDFIGQINGLPPETRPLKVILTGRLLERHHEDHKRLDVFATLLKPFSTDRVLEIVKEGFCARAPVAASGR
jgi:two-component system cell cycle sensor histidine kinase/response regulator CckA